MATGAPQIPCHRAALKCVRRTWVGVIPFLALFVAGCSLIPEPQRQLATPSYQPENVFTGAPALPPNLKRLAVLPISCDQDPWELQAGREILQPILQSELGKTKKFEVLAISPDLLRATTGSTGWSDDEALPAKFFEVLRERSGCDAVLFCRLTAFRSQAPLAVGWRMRLVDDRSHATLWSVDEIIDDGQSGVRAGARRFQRAELQAGNNVPDDWLISNSPRQFGQYATALLLRTMPPR